MLKLFSIAGGHTHGDAEHMSHEHNCSAPHNHGH